VDGASGGIHEPSGLPNLAVSALYILILVSLVVALGFLAAYIWAVRGGQYDDTTTPSMRILMDEPATPTPAPHAAEASGPTEKPVSGSHSASASGAGTAVAARGPLTTEGGQGQTLICGRTQSLVTRPPESHSLDRTCIKATTRYTSWHASHR